MDIDILGLRQHRDRRRRSMDAPAAFGRGHALHPMNPAFKLQPGEHALPGDAGDDFLIAADVGRGGGDQLDPPAAILGIRSEESRVGKKWVSTFRSRWSPYN